MTEPRLREQIKAILTEVATKAVLLCPDMPNEDYYADRIWEAVQDELGKMSFLLDEDYENK